MFLLPAHTIIRLPAFLIEGLVLLMCIYDFERFASGRRHQSLTP